MNALIIAALSASIGSLAVSAGLVVAARRELARAAQLRASAEASCAALQALQQATPPPRPAAPSASPIVIVRPWPVDFSIGRRVN